MESFKKYLSELIGTCVLVFLGCGTAALTGGGAGYILTAFAFGFALIAMCYCVGNISGAHLNPAISAAMLMMRKIGVVDFVGYVAAQLIGAIAGSALVFAIINGTALTDATGNYGANTAVNSGGSFS